MYTHNEVTASNPKKVQIREFNQLFLFSRVGKKNRKQVCV